MSGYRAMKLASRGISQSERSADTQVIDRDPDFAGRVIRAVAAAISSNADVTEGNRSAPCSVSVSLCPLRSNSLTFSDVSSALIWWLMAP